MLKYLKDFLNRFARMDTSPKRLAASFCFGVFVSITPTVPFQTPIILGLGWLLGFNTVVAFASSWLFSNPFTLVPVYLIDYAFGVWFFEKVVGFDLVRYNPWWIEKFNGFLSRYIDVQKHFGTNFCLWCLLFGGLMVALLVSIPLYFILERVFATIIKQLGKKKAADQITYEDHRTK